MFIYDWALVGFGLFILLICFLCFCRMWRIRRYQSRKETTGCIHVSYAKNKTCCNDNCAVCLEEFQPKETITICPCKHGFHKKCLSEWLKQHNTCPMCKSDVTVCGERSILVET
ncbi:RING finger protein 24-like [Gigantopelta aegis]|uniref:RING finger protein 24-like n=1 Tax=Gigantopelta aegis TaxID=1735272 RepID=UPI001B88B470|nr:RING finger protein 24-like [Gigantopelta aegis]